MNSVPLPELLEAGMHFGHLTRRWNPKMKPYIYGVRNGIHIIDLSKTVKQFQEALRFVTQAVSNGGDVLFVGTKRQAQDVISEEALRCKMFYVNHRWLGGTLTNFRTIKSSIDRLKKIQQGKEDGSFSALSKKELLMMDREVEKLVHALGGIQDMVKIPEVMVVVDPNLERIALHEANMLGIKIVALADTNCDPDPVDYLVAGNDDALRSIRLFLSKIADQVLEGLQGRELNARRFAEERRERDDARAGVREVEGNREARAAYVSEAAKTSEASQEEVVEGQYSARVETPEVATPPDSE